MKKLLSWVPVVITLAFAIMVNTSYIETGGKFIDFSRWKELTFWVQIGVNTLLLTQIYARTLRKNKDDMIKSNDHIQELYVKLFSHKDRIIKENRKEDLNVFLSVYTNIVEKLENHIYYLEKRIRRSIRHSRKIYFANQHEKYEKYLASIKLLDFSDKQDIHSIKAKGNKNTFDTIFDLVDYKSSRPISISYSDEKETTKKIAKSPLSSFVTMFTSIVAFGNLLIFSSDYQSMALIVLAVSFAAYNKYQRAIDDAKEIATNKSRSLERAVDTVEIFLSVKTENLDKMKSLVTETVVETLPETNTFDIPNLSVS